MISRATLAPRPASAGVSRFATLAYAMPAVATQFVIAPFGAVLPGVYVMHFGISAAVVGIALMAMRIADAVTDPLVGVLSDRTRSRIGSRKPWLIGGAILTAIAGCFALGPTGQPSIWYLIGWGSLFYLGWTMIEIPHAAWGAEISRDQNRRTSLFFARAFCGVAGAMGFAALPFLPIFSSTEITPRTLSVTALVFLVLAPLTIGAAVLLTPGQQASSEKAQPTGWRPFMRSLRSNRPLWRFLAAYSSAGIGFGMFGSLQYVFLSSYLQLGPRVAHALGVSFICGLLALPVWLGIVKRWGKHRPWCVGLGVISLCMASMFLLPAGVQSFWPYLLLAALIALSSGAGLIVPYSLLGDIVDYDTWRTGERRGGSFFALFTLVVKANIALGGGLAFLTLGWAGYEAAQQVNTVAGVLGLKVAFGLLPAALAFAAAAMMWNFPIDARRHQLIKHRLDAREARTL